MEWHQLGLRGSDATLYADPCYNGEVGTHYAGPTWEAEDGSKVVAARFSDCTPNRGAIPWLRLDATSSSPQGKFGLVTHVLRVNTIGGRLRPQWERLWAMKRACLTPPSTIFTAQSN